MSKLHWFLFSFRYISTTNENVWCCYRGFEVKEPLITKATILGIKNEWDMPSNSVLIAVSYLGRGTREEFDNEPT